MSRIRFFNFYKLFVIQNYLVLGLYNIKSHAILFKRYINIFLQISLRLFKLATLFIFVS